MAKVLGKSGRYVSEQSVAKRRQIWLLSILGTAILCLIEGYMIANWIPLAKFPPAISLLIMLCLLFSCLFFYRSFNKQLDALEKDRAALHRGAVGEIAVGFILETFPGNFYVINDLTTPFGNLDHVVVGPTGVYVIDTKNWRGIVTSDGKGELLLNGNPTDKAFIRQFVARMMSVREKVCLIASCPDIFFQAVFVFTSAKVKADWGTSSTVHCIRDDQLNDYIVHKDFGHKLQPHEVEKIAQAFLALAHMDKEFGPTSQVASKSKNSGKILA